MIPDTECPGCSGKLRDVAYMPVPRCDQCKHYDTGVRGGFLHCENPEMPDQSMNWFEVPGPSFGCVLWEPKEDLPIKSKSMAKRIAALKGGDVA